MAGGRMGTLGVRGYRGPIVTIGPPGGSLYNDEVIGSVLGLLGVRRQNIISHDGVFWGGHCVNDDVIRSMLELRGQWAELLQTFLLSYQGSS